MKRKRFSRQPRGFTTTKSPSGANPAFGGTPPNWDAIRHEIRSILESYRDEILSAVREEVRSGSPKPTGDRVSYSVAEVASMLSKSVFTVSEWCRLGRIHATKRAERRGGAELWNITAREVSRYLNEGLLPIERPIRD